MVWKVEGDRSVLAGGRRPLALPGKKRVVKTSGEDGLWWLRQC